MWERESEGVSYQQNDELIVTIGKYFLHGAVFSIAFNYMFSFIMVFMLILLFISIIGILLILPLGFILMGAINHGLAGYLWKIESRSNPVSLIGQGFVLGLISMIVQIPAMVVELMLMGGPPDVYLVYLIIQFIGLSFFSGIVGKQVAVWFKDETRAIHRPWEGIPGQYHQGEISQGRPAVSTGIPTYCPSCRAAFPIKQSDLDASGSARCRLCDFEIMTQGYSDLTPQSTQARSPCPYCSHDLPPRSMSDQTGGIVTCSSCGASFKDNRPRTSGSQQPRKQKPDWDW